MTTGLEYVPLTERVGYFKGATNIGVIAEPQDGGTRLWLVDTPNTVALTKCLWGELQRRFPRPRLDAIINTHSHADRLKTEPLRRLPLPTRIMAFMYWMKKMRRLPENCCRTC